MQEPGPGAASTPASAVPGGQGPPGEPAPVDGAGPPPSQEPFDSLNRPSQGPPAAVEEMAPPPPRRCPPRMEEMAAAPPPHRTTSGRPDLKPEMKAELDAERSAQVGAMLYPHNQNLQGPNGKRKKLSRGYTLPKLAHSVSWKQHEGEGVGPASGAEDQGTACTRGLGSCRCDDSIVAWYASWCWLVIRSSAVLAPVLAKKRAS
jgi:hypothetical protein